MKKAFLITLASLMIAAPMAQAQQYRPDDRRPPQHHQPVKPQKPVASKVAPKPYYWKKGQRMNDWRRHQAINDYRRYGLHKPGRDQRWIRIDNQYLLIGVTTGLIAGIANAR